MQERYLGDSHDYIKFALLRFLQRRLALRIGVNWYLNRPEDNGDGEQRGFLDDEAWKPLDKLLLDKLRPFGKPEYRTLRNFESDGILPGNTLFFKDYVSHRVDRPRWHKRAISALSEADLIFLDQDNGFQVKSMTARTEPKYALYDEASDYLELGKIVVAIQFARQCDPKARGKTVREKLQQTAPATRSLPMLLGRVAPNILFLTICPNHRASQVHKALEDFARRSPRFKGGNRIELIP